MEFLVVEDIRVDRARGRLQLQVELREGLDVQGLGVRRAAVVDAGVLVVDPFDLLFGFGATAPDGLALGEDEEAAVLDGLLGRCGLLRLRQGLLPRLLLLVLRVVLRGRWCDG